MESVPFLGTPRPDARSLNCIHRNRSTDLHKPSSIEEEDHFHTTDEKNLQYARNVLHRALENGLIIQDDAGLIREFVAEVRSTSSTMTAKRIFKIQSILVYFRTFIPPCRTSTIPDLYQGTNDLKRAKRLNSRSYAAGTQNDYVKLLRRFYVWMTENGYSSLPEKKIKKIRAPSTKQMTKTAEDLVTGEESLAMPSRSTLFHSVSRTG